MLGIGVLTTSFSIKSITIPSIKDLRRRLTKASHVNGSAKPAAAPAVGQVDEPVYQPPPGPPPSQNGTLFEHNGIAYTQAQLQYLVAEIKDYQITHGSLLKGVRYETESTVPARPVGASILPTQFPRVLYEEAVELQATYSELYMRVASDPDWLFEVLSPLLKHDRLFTALWEIYEEVRRIGPAQNVVCALIRNDYMLHQPGLQDVPVLKQVEMNTFTCAGAAHAERIANMHKHLQRVRSISPYPTDILHPQNENVKSIVDMLLRAHSIYCQRQPAPSTRPKCVIITVQPNNFNIADERPIELAFWDRGIPCYRVEWADLSRLISLTSDQRLLFRPPFATEGQEFEVSVVYYRGGYIIAEYTSSGKQARIDIEVCRAVKCPDILTHLSGFKSVQAALVKDGAVERFLSADKAAFIRKTFMYMQTLDTTPTGQEARKLATDTCQCMDYVLKPNRDGGGHNVYRADIPSFLAGKPEEEWVQYTLMRLIEPPPATGMLMMPQDLYNGEVVSELGVLGTCIWERREHDLDVVQNDVAGWTFKTKPKGVDEMAVVKGYGVFDCPELA